MLWIITASSKMAPKMLQRPIFIKSVTWLAITKTADKIKNTPQNHF